MRKKRIHNTYSFSWALLPGGSPLDLTGRTLKIFMRSDLDTVEISEFTVATNVVSWSWLGSAQKYLGKYDAVLVDADNNVVIDVQTAIELVKHSWEEEELDSTTIALSTTVSLVPGPQGPTGPTGPTGPQGETGNGIASASIDASGYLTLVYTDGTTWISPTSLIGPQGQAGADGANGSDGGLLYPTFAVDAAMHLQMSDNDAAVEDRFAVTENGHFQVNF